MYSDDLNIAQGKSMSNCESNNCIMERIRAVLHSMSKTEIRYLKQYLTAFNPKGEKHNRALEFIRLLEENPEMSQDELAGKLYGSPQDKAYLMLKRRVFDKMLETLSLSVNLKNNPVFKEDPSAFKGIELKKQLSYAHLLRRRGLSFVAENVLEKCVKTAEEWDQPEVKLEALIQLRNLSQNADSVRKVYNPAIENALQKYSTAILGVGFFDEVRSHLPNHLDTEMLNFLTEKTSYLEHALGKTYSARAHYYKLCMELILMESKEEKPIECRQILEQMIELIGKNKGLKTKNRMGVPFKQLAEIELMSYNFEAAKHAAERAMHILPKRKTNFLYAGIYKIYACIYLGEYLQAKEELSNLHWFIEHPPEPLLAGWLKYLGACLAFLQNNLSEAYQKYLQITELFSYKNDWNPTMRIFEIQLMIERNHLDVASNKIESLRKHIARYPVSPRLEYIYRYLSTLERHSFDLNAKQSSLKKWSNKIIGDPSWTPLSREVIPFNVWLKHKSQGSKFSKYLPKEVAIGI